MALGMKGLRRSIEHIVERQKQVMASTGVGPWVLRLVLALLLAFSIGALPVYVVHEYRATRLMERELRELMSANERLVDEIERRRMELRILKTPEGRAKVLRDKGYVPRGSTVYTIAR